MPDHPSPFELPFQDQALITHSEVIDLFVQFLNDRQKSGIRSAIYFRDRCADDILKLSEGSGYYKLDPYAALRGVPPTAHELRHIGVIQPEVPYFGIDVSDIQILIGLQAPELKIFVRGRVSPSAPWTDWKPWKNDRVSMPVNRELLIAQIDQHL